MAGGLIPERLITIRRYSSAGPAVDDCRLLIDNGLDAYIRTYRWQDIGEVRVPESQVERALALLPGVDSTGQAEVVERCPWCGSRHARTFAPFTGLVLAGGAGLVPGRQEPHPNGCGDDPPRAGGHRHDHVPLGVEDSERPGGGNDGIAGTDRRRGTGPGSRGCPPG